MRIFFCPALGAVAAAALVAAAGCDDPGKTKPRETPPPAVEAAVVERGRHRVANEFIATVRPLKSVKLVARVDGFLKEKHFDGGTFVREGALLYLIEPEHYELALDQARSRLDRCRADERKANLELQRISELHREKIASPRQLDNAVAAADSAKAQTAAAEAGVAQAELNLSYTRIVAPFDGWIGLNTLDAGNYLAAPSRTLAEISFVDQVKVEFHLSDAYLTGALLQALGDGVPPDWPVALKMRDGSPYPLPGRIRFWENEVSTTSATMTIQAVFDNPERRLVPGLYVTAILSDPDEREVLLLDRRALLARQGEYFAMVIGKNDVLEFRRIVTGAFVGDRVVVVSGLDEGESVALTGNPLLRPGVRVRVVR